MAEMTKEARAARAKYMREWRKKNPEKQREYDAKKWERKTVAVLTKSPAQRFI